MVTVNTQAVAFKTQKECKVEAPPAVFDVAGQNECNISPTKYLHTD